MQPASAATGSGEPGRDRPRFRQDLIAETVEHQGARFIDVMAPEGDDVFRFYEVEYSLACGMDGERDIAGIVKWAQDELGLTPSPQEVRTVIATLGDLGFIESAAAEAAEAPELVPGVVAEPAARAARPTPSGFDLGAAEADHGDTERGAPLPVAPDLALGAAGAPRPARLTPQAHDVVLGASGAGEAPGSGGWPGAQSEASDVSIDLSDHIAVRPDDVKEAVRASRVMDAVEPPPDSDALEVIQDPATAPASAFDAPTVARIPDPAMLAELTPRPPPSARSPEPPPSVRASDAHRAQDLPTADTIKVGKSQLRAPASPSKPPVELPAAPVTVKVDKPMPPPVQRGGTSPLLLVVLILAILGAGVFFAWKYVLERPAIDVDTSSAPVPAPVKPAPPPPPPAPPPTAKIALETPDPEDVKVMRQGLIESIPAGDTAVKDAEVIAKLKGYKPLEAQVNAMTNDLNRQHALLDAAAKVFEAAHAAGNKAKEAAAQAEVTERRKLVSNKQSALTAKRADLDTYQVRAPRNGTFVPSTKPNTTVAADTVIGKLQREPIPVATFKLGSTRSFASNGSVEISIHKGEQRVTCTVADVQSDSVKVVCPSDPDLTEGLEVALLAPAAASAAPPEPPPLPSSGAGSAAGSAAPAEPAGGTGVPAPPAEAPGGSPAPGEPGGAAGSAPPASPAPSGSAAPAAGSDGRLPS
ncbi:MAG TPA: hypothetical protein VHT91_46470 [Kofleriaceae bacterium]|jgi:hypothetical protein|nr:hypothetical protein [Kofleriaceae bacterium]